MFPLAHIKWFIEKEYSSTSPIYDLSLSDPRIIIWISIVGILLILAYFLERKIKGPSKKFIKTARKISPQILHLFQILVGISILFASHRGALLQPHFQGSEFGGIFQVVEALTGILLIADVFTCHAAILLVITYLSTFFLFGTFEALDYINLIGIATFIYLKNNCNKKYAKHHHLAIPILRIFTGLTLFILAFSEKLLFADMAYEVVERYNLNFMPYFGFEVFDYNLFILSAGAMEAAFGLIMIFGWITRINTIVLTAFFLASNIYFFLAGYHEEGLIELMGHLPVIATVLVLVLYGSGNKKKEDILLEK
jgi:uncharacterized membrane protein YphA (DoxX/SURF4 family)